MNFTWSQWDFEPPADAERDARPAHKRIIYESEHVRVIYQPQDGDEVVITFNEIGRCADGLSFWADGALAREGVAAVGVVSMRPNWFPADEGMIEAIRRTIADGGHRRVVTYGCSQGGFGALKHSAALSADAVVAFCPQWSICATDVAGADDRFVQYRAPGLHDGMRIEAEDVAGDVFVCFDPRLHEDRWNAERIAERVLVHSVLAPFTGHASARFAIQSGIGRELLRTLAARSPAPARRAAVARGLIRAARSSSPEYWLGRAKMSAARQTPSAEVVRSLVQASHGAAGDADVLVGVAALYLDAGDTQQALVHAHLAAAAADPAATHTTLRIWDVMDRLGVGAMSLEMMRAAVAASPFNAFLRLHLVKTLVDVRAAATLEAGQQIAQATMTAGDQVMLWRHIEHASRLVGQEEAQRYASLRLSELAGDAPAAELQAEREDEPSAGETRRDALARSRRKAADQRAQVAVHGD